MTKPTPEQLEAAAAAMRDARQVAAWHEIDVTDTRLSLYWHTGNSDPGYKLIETEVHALVRQALPGLIETAIRTVEDRAAAALKEIGL